jgi:hypothetical protein
MPWQVWRTWRDSPGRPWGLRVWNGCCKAANEMLAACRVAETKPWSSHQAPVNGPSAC